MKRPKPKFRGKSKKAQAGLMPANSQGNSIVVTGTPEYAKAYNERRLTSGYDSSTDTYNMAQMLPEITVTPYNKGTFEQGIRDAGESVVNTTLDLMGEPQRRMMQGLTGKMQTPSQAWGFQNPGNWSDGAGSFLKNAGNFTMDAVADPTNLIGAGLVDDALKLGARSGLVKAAKVGADRIATPQDVRKFKRLSGEAANVIKQQKFPAKLSKDDAQKLHDIRVIGKITNENTGWKGLEKALKYIDRVDEDNVKSLTGMNKSEILNYVNRHRENSKKIANEMSSGYMGARGLGISREQFTPPPGWTEQINQENIRRVTNQNFDFNDFDYGPSDFERDGYEMGDIFNQGANNAPKLTKAEYPTNNLVWDEDSFDYISASQKPSLLSKVNKSLRNKLESRERKQYEFDKDYDQYSELLRDGAQKGVLAAGQGTNPAKDVIRIRKFLEEAPSGYKAIPAGSLSSDSFKLSYSALPDLLKKNPGKYELKSLGVNSMNGMGFLSNAGVRPQIIIAEMNDIIRKLRQTSGNKQIPFAEISKEGAVRYPVVGINKKRSGGRIMTGTIMNNGRQSSIFTETFEKSDYGEKSNWPNKYRKELLGRGLPNVLPLPFEKGGAIRIKPENRGKFTAWAKKHGLGVSQAASKVMANKEEYSPGVVRMANFAKNAAGWKKSNGGEILWGAPQSQRERYLAHGGEIANKQFGDKTIEPVKPYKFPHGGVPIPQEPLVGWSGQPPANPYGDLSWRGQLNNAMRNTPAGKFAAPQPGFWDNVWNTLTSPSPRAAEKAKSLYSTKRVIPNKK